jgi:hypothetical protein
MGAAVALLVASASRAPAQGRTISLTGAPLATLDESFSAINGFQEIAPDKVVIADVNEKKLVLGDLKTNSVRNIGRQGGGPGEWQMALNVLPAPGGTVYVSDPSLRRLHVPHHYINIDEDLDGLERAKALNHGQRRTPTIDLGIGGPPLVEPDNETLAGAQTLKLAENRAAIRAQAADLLWTRDEKRARTLFRDAAADIASALGQEDARRSQSGWMLMQLRSQLLFSAATRDAQLALELLRDSRPAAAHDDCQPPLRRSIAQCRARRRSAGPVRRVEVVKRDR